MGHHTEVFVGIDTSKSRNAIAIADGGRGGEVRYLGEFSATEAAIRKVPGGGPLARSEEGRRSSEDEPARCG